MIDIRSFNSHLTRFFLSALVLGLLFLSAKLSAQGFNGATEKLDQKAATALTANIAQYEYSLGNYFQSLSEIEFAKAQNLTTSDAKIKLLQAKILQYFDMDEHAYQLYLENLSVKTSTASAPDSAQQWLALAQQAYRNGNYTVATDALNNIDVLASTEITEPYYFLLAQLRLQQNSNSDVKAQLSKINKDSIFARYLNFNLAIRAVNNHDLNTAFMRFRLVTEGAERGSQLPNPATSSTEPHSQNQLKSAPAVVTANNAKLESAANTPKVTTPEKIVKVELSVEANALIDKAYLYLGNLYMQQRKFALASNEFKAVSVNSAVTESALLGYGWATLKLDDYENALAIFQRVIRNTIFTPSVQEAYLAIPYVLEKLERPKLALQAYHTAVTRIEKQIKALNEALVAAQQQEFLAPLLIKKRVHADDGPGKQPIKARKLALALPAAINTYELVSSNQFQRDLKDLKDINTMIKQLNTWALEVNAVKASISELKAAQNPTQQFSERIKQKLSKAKKLQFELTTNLTEAIKQMLIKQKQDLQSYRQMALIAITKISDGIFVEQSSIVKELRLIGPKDQGSSND